MFSIEMFKQDTRHFGLVRTEKLTEQIAIKIVYSLQELTGKRVKQITGHADFVQEWKDEHAIRYNVNNDSALNVAAGAKELNFYAPGVKILLEGCFLLPRGIFMVTFHE